MPGGADSSHTSKVKGTNKLAKKNQRKFEPPQLLDKQRYDAENAEDGANNVKGRYNIASGMVGRYARSDPRDTDKAIKQQLARDPKQFGIVHATDEDVDYMKSKKEQEYYWRSLRLGQYLIDAERPETQDHAFAVFPELKDYPDEYHRDNLAVQEALRTMLRDGKLGGKEDHELIMHICRPDFELPIFPVWDPQGLTLTGEGDLKTAFQNYISYGLKNATQTGFFSPRKWNADAGAQQASELQQKLKIMILRRLYPGLRDKDNEEISRFLKTISPATEEEGTNDAIGFYNKFSEVHIGGPSNALSILG